MHGAVVQRILPADDAQETRGQFVGLGAQPRHPEQFFAALEIAVRGAVRHDVLRQRRPQSGNIGEDVFRGGVDVHPDPVHAAFDHRIEPGLEFSLVDAVLVLPDADRLGVDLHQLRERVDQPPADAHRAAHRHVVIGKLLARRGRRRVDRCAVLADHEYLHGSVQSQAAHQLLGFAPRRTVADCEGLGPVFPRQRPQHFRRFGIAALRRVRVDGRIVHEVAL